MADLKHIAILRRGVSFWNRWREKNPGISPDISRAVLGNSDFREINFSNTNLHSTNLSGADLSKADLTEAVLSRAKLIETDLSNVISPRANYSNSKLYNAKFIDAELSNATFNGATLNKADFTKAHLEEAFFLQAECTGTVFTSAALNGATLNGCTLFNVNFEGAELSGSYLKSVTIEDSNLSHASLDRADLNKAIFLNSNLSNVNLSDAICTENTFDHCDLCGTNARAILVNGGTLLRECKIDEYTDFELVGLDTLRIDSVTKELLRFNIRKKHWDEWEPYYHHRSLMIRPLLRLIYGAKLHKIFLKVSNYGLSSTRIAKYFICITMFFAVLYYAWGAIDYYYLKINYCPGVVENLFVVKCSDAPKQLEESNQASGDMQLEEPNQASGGKQLEEPNQVVSCYIIPVRAIYFSIVTMTTLGFGDMYAMPMPTSIANNHKYCRYAIVRSLAGHVCLVFQVILGYIFLGALITRFGIIFTGSGPIEDFDTIRARTNANSDNSQDD